MKKITKSWKQDDKDWLIDEDLVKEAAASTFMAPGYIRAAVKAYLDADRKELEDTLPVKVSVTHSDGTLLFKKSYDWGDEDSIAVKPGTSDYKAGCIVLISHFDAETPLGPIRQVTPYTIELKRG